MRCQKSSFERAVTAADAGFQKWKNIAVAQRIQTVRALRKTIQKRSHMIAEAISAECCRPKTEALIQEVMPVLEMAKYCEKNYKRWISVKSISYYRPLFLRKKTTLVREPLGVIAVLSPRNFPFSMGMMALIYTVLAGNTVILKPSEKSELLPALLKQLLEESLMEERGAVVLLEGGVEIGEKLIEHPYVQKIIFFGNQASGEKIANICVKYCKSFVLEAGGGSTAFVLKDADLDLAAHGLAWSAFYANGQSCVATEKIFVDHRVCEEFVAKLKEKVRSIGRDKQQDPLAVEFSDSDHKRYSDIFEHMKSTGGEIFSIGKKHPQATFPPTVITNVIEQNVILEKEIFGPMVILMSVENITQAAENYYRNLSSLGTSIWTKDKKKAAFLAKKIPVGMIWINDSSFGLPHLPWGGWGKYNWGTLFSKYSLHEVTRVKWMSRHPSWQAKPRLWWTPYSSYKKKVLSIATRYYL